MRVRILVATALVCGVAIAGCSRAPEPVPLPAPTVPAPVPTEDGLAPFYEQAIEWRDCGDAECARIDVPLDYSNLDGRTTELSLTRVPAADEPIGALFVNPGGPGGSAFDYARAADYIVSPSIRDAFDIIGVDPRGVAGSDPIRCWSDAEIDYYFASDGTPDTPTEAEAIAEDTVTLVEACDSKAGDVWEHMDTISTTRDMDIVRSLLDEPVLNYLGKSYGTAIGTTYAELFPQRVGRMVLDGVLPVTASQEEVTFGQAVSFEESVKHFAADCVDSGECPFAGNSREVEQALRSFLAGLDDSPLPTSGDRELTESLGQYAVLSFLYFPSSDYPRLRAALTEAVEENDGTALLSLVDERVNRSPDGRYLDNSTEAFYAVTCADMPYDATVDEVARLAAQWQEVAPTFGEAFAWGMLACVGWPQAAENLDSVSGAGAAPILVVSTRQDPATPYDWGVDLARSLEDAHLVTWDATNHTAYREGSSCVDEVVDEYLLTGATPPEDVTCD